MAQAGSAFLQSAALLGVLRRLCLGSCRACAGKRKLVGADSVRLSVQGLKKHSDRINLFLALCRRKVEFADLQRGYFRESVNVSFWNICGVHPGRISTSLLIGERSLLLSCR